MPPFWDPIDITIRLALMNLIRSHWSGFTAKPGWYRHLSWCYLCLPFSVCFILLCLTLIYIPFEAFPSFEKHSLLHLPSCPSCPNVLHLYLIPPSPLCLCFFVHRCISQVVMFHLLLPLLQTLCIYIHDSVSSLSTITAAYLPHSILH